MGNHLEEWHWLDEERLQKIKDERDDYDAPRFGLRYNQGVPRNQIIGGQMGKKILNIP